MDNTIFQAAMAQLELLSVVYNNVRIEGLAPITPDGYKLTVELEKEMKSLFDYIQTNAKGQV